MSIFIPLTEPERDELLRLIASGQPLPEGWRGRLFPDSPHAIEIGKEYQLVYEGKARREEVLAETPAAPWQLVRRFCADRPFDDGWRNLLVWGDNLLALRELRADQRGPDRLGTRGKIKLIYIDPPFATRQDFMKDILEVENTLSWGYEPSRAQYTFPLHNLRYQPEQTTVEVKREAAREPQVTFQPQARTTTEYSRFSETGLLAVEISHHDLYDIEDAVAVMRLFIREKDEALAQVWTKERLRASSS